MSSCIKGASSSYVEKNTYISLRLTIGFGMASREWFVPVWKGLDEFRNIWVVL